MIQEVRKMTRKYFSLFAVVVLGVSPLFLSHYATALPGSTVYSRIPCEGCHSYDNGGVKDYEEHIVLQIYDEQNKQLVDESTKTVTIPFKKGKLTRLKVVFGTDGKVGKDHLLAGWYFDLPAGVDTAEGDVHYCYQQLNYPGGSKFAYKGNQNLTTAKAAFSFHRYFDGAETELWMGVGKRTNSQEGLSLKTYRLKWTEVFE
jgi:hypothetical protein